MQYRVIEEGTATPRYRFKLKGKIHSQGYRYVSEFACVVRADNATMSRVICGWEHPNAKLQRKMADALGITLRELQTLL